MKPLTSDGLMAWQAFRRELHRQPECSGEEVQTAAAVVRQLRPLEPDAVWEGVGGAGVVALFNGGAGGPTTLLRAELDGLPIAEWADAAERPHRSVVAGKSHMNMMLVDVSQLDHVEPGDEVTLIGQQGDLQLTVASFGELSDQLNYELLTRLPENIPRQAVD